MKTPETITILLHARSDKKLRERLNSSVNWVWNEVGEHHAKRPGCVNDLNEKMRGTTFPEFKEVPWTGSVSELWVEVQFLYLRDICRDKEVSDFMSKVDEIKEVFEVQPE